ncbi:amphi-Trp domain-containing protein [Streptomyces griseorubiginosus]|uniref:amphi-Trp domain-containing protein n=1 Tax=Streptomyces griseorubiginosus TaxID=67304 RepID=UPI0036E1D726
MKDLKFEQKSSLSRAEAADRLDALAAALREGGEAELELGSGTTVSLRIPDDLRTEVEVEVGDGEIELEIEFKWSTRRPRTAPSQPAARTEKAAGKKTVPARSGRTGTDARRGKSG